MQLEPGHRLRNTALRDQGLEWSARQFDPDRANLSESASDEIAERYLGAAVRARGTLLLSPTFTFRDVGLRSRARENSIRLTHAYVELAKRSGVLAGSPAGGPRRLVIAGLSVNASSLRFSAQRRALVSAYGEVDADAYIVWAWGFTGQASHVRLIRELARALQRHTGKACIVGGMGDLWHALLRNGVAGACTGYGRSRICWPPHELPRDEDGTVSGVGINFHQPEVLGSMQIGKPGRDRRLAVLSRNPCACGHHHPAAEPSGTFGFHKHNLRCNEDEAVAATRQAPDVATRELRPRVIAARRLREEVGAGNLAPGWDAACEDGAPREMATPVGGVPWRHLAPSRR
jgi:hypothetical protein